MQALAHLRSEVKDFFDLAIDPILLVRKQEGLEKVQLLVILYASSYILILQVPTMVSPM
jgi:hypothetical protein